MVKYRVFNNKKENQSSSDRTNLLRLQTVFCPTSESESQSGPSPPTDIFLSNNSVHEL